MFGTLCLCGCLLWEPCTHRPAEPGRPQARGQQGLLSHRATTTKPNWQWARRSLTLQEKPHTRFLCAKSQSLTIGTTHTFQTLRGPRDAILQTGLDRPIPLDLVSGERTASIEPHPHRREQCSMWWASLGKPLTTFGWNKMWTQTMFS